MRRTALVILGAAAGLVALLLIAVAIVVATVDPNRFVAPLTARVKAETGRTLAIGGPVDLTVSLEPKIVLPDVAFGNAPWSKTPQMLTAKRVEAQIALLPLLSRRFEVIRFTLVEPTITLETDASGRGNWEFATPAQPGSASARPAAAGAAIGVGNFEIQRGTLTYRNGASGKTTVAAIDRFVLRARDLAKPAAVDFRGRVDDVPIALEGELGPPSQWLAQQWPYRLALKGEIDGRKLRLTTKIAQSGATTALEDLALDYGPIAAKGRVQSTSQGTKTRYAFALDIPVLSLAALSNAKDTVAGNRAGSTRPAAGGPAPAPAAPGGRFIASDAPLPLGALGAIDGDGTLAIGTLELRNGQTIGGVTVKIASADAKMDLDFAAKVVLGGTLTGQVDVDARRSDSPGVRLQLTARDLDLPKLAATAGIQRDIRGGKVRADIDVAGRGTTPHALASTMSGTILVVAKGPATLARATTQEPSAASQVAAALDPLRAVDAATELRCAVLRLPLANGVAHVDRSIALETAKIAGSASGTIDFRTETLDLSVRPQIREGIKIDVSQFAGLVHIRGPFAKPEVAIDAAQTAQMIAKLGMLGAQVGGIEAIGRALVAPADEAAAPCAIASSGKAPRDEPASRTRQAAPDRALPNDLGRDVGKALGKLFGR